MDNKNVIEFYDNFVDAQQNTGINDRIYGLYNRLIKLGLKSDSNVLELGCGIGVMTYLLSQTVKKGWIEAVEISPESIKFAAKKLKRSNIYFHVHDIVNYAPSLKKIDFIILFDVIEHIPKEKHNELFKNISKICDDNTKILINIPNPKHIEYDIENQPESLQIIDQPLPLNFIVENLISNDLDLIFFETYSIWLENDYQFFVINKKRKFKKIKLSDKRNLFQKGINKINRTWVKLIHNYR